MVTRPDEGQTSGPGRFAPARLLLALLLAAPSVAAAQPPAAAVTIPIPDEAGAARLVWSTMAALDHANKTGNYSVLRALGSAAFQASNSEVALSGIFVPLRQQRLDLTGTLGTPPSYDFPPRLEGGLLRVRGAFRTRPQAVQFDLLFQWNQGWVLQGIAVSPVPFPSLPRPR